MQWQTSLPLSQSCAALPRRGAGARRCRNRRRIRRGGNPAQLPEWEKSIPTVVEAFGDKALIGAGTVLQPEQVERLAKMGCKLIVTPNINPEVIRRAVSHGMTVCPGCATATEALPPSRRVRSRSKFSPLRPLVLTISKH